MLILPYHYKGNRRLTDVRVLHSDGNTFNIIENQLKNTWSFFVPWYYWFQFHRLTTLQNGTVTRDLRYEWQVSQIAFRFSCPLASQARFGHSYHVIIKTFRVSPTPIHIDVDGDSGFNYAIHLGLISIAASSRSLLFVFWIAWKIWLDRKSVV